MKSNIRKGFTLIELLIVVVIIGILAAVAIPKFANTKDKAKVASIKTDLRNLVSAQEGHFADYNRYAATATNTARSATNVNFNQTPGNGAPTITVVGTPAGSGGWAATMTRTDLAAATTCGVYVGAATAPNAAITAEGQVACW